MRISISSLLALAVILSVIGYPLVAGFSELLSIDNRTMSIMMRAVIVAMSLTALVRLNIRKLSHPSALAFLFTAFWGMYITRIAFDTSFKAADLGRAPLDYWAFGVGTCFVPGFALLMTRTVPDVQILSRWTLNLAILAGLLVLAKGNTSAIDSNGHIYDSGRFNIDTLNPIFFGHLGATIFLLSYWKVRMEPKKHARQIFYFIAVTYGAYLVILSSSRGPLVALVASTLFIELTKGKYKFLITSFIIVLITLQISVNFTELTKLDILLGISFFDRIQGALFLTDVSASGRLLQVTSSWHLFLENPAIGSALEDPTFAIYPHNVLVEAFMATGLVGGLLFSLFLLGVILKAIKLVNQRSSYGFLTPLLIQYVVAAQFSGGLWNANVMWVLAAVIASIELKSRNTCQNIGNELHLAISKEHKIVRFPRALGI